MLKNIASYTELPDSSEKTIDIGFDCDDVLFSCSDYAIEKVNEDYNLDLDPNKVTRWGYKIGDYKKMYQYFSDENFVKNQPVLDGAVEFLKKLSKVPNVKIYFVTAVPASMMSIRAETLKKYFPFIDEKNFILTSSKNITKFDIFVDDNPNNILSNKSEFRIVKRQKWNEHITGMLSFNTFDELWEIIFRILEKKGVRKNKDVKISKIITLVGPSGANKNEIANYLIESGMKMPVSYTTDTLAKEKRTSKKISNERFEEMLNSGEVCFPAYYGKNKYAFGTSELKELVKNDEYIVTITDINSAYALKAKYGAEIVYCNNQKESLIADILERNCSKEEMVNRIMALEVEKDNAKLCDYIIPETDTAKKAAQRIINMVNKSVSSEE